MSHIKRIAETRVYICDKNMKSMSFFSLFVCLFFYSFSNVFEEKIYKKYSTGNEEWIESETALMQRDYVLHNHLNIS